MLRSREEEGKRLASREGGGGSGLSGCRGVGREGVGRTEGSLARVEGEQEGVVTGSGQDVWCNAQI